MHYGHENLRAVPNWLPVQTMCAIDRDCIIKFILNVFFKYSENVKTKAFLPVSKYFFHKGPSELRRRKIILFFYRNSGILIFLYLPKNWSGIP